MTFMCGNLAPKQNVQVHQQFAQLLMERIIRKHSEQWLTQPILYKQQYDNNVLTRG